MEDQFIQEVKKEEPMILASGSSLKSAKELDKELEEMIAKGKNKSYGHWWSRKQHH